MTLMDVLNSTGEMSMSPSLKQAPTLPTLTFESDADEDRDDYEVTAQHEACHAFSSRALLLGGGPASIIGDEESAGFAVSPSAEACAEIWEAAGRKTYLNLTPVQARVVIAMPGVAAEVLFNGRHVGGHESDWELIHGLCDGNEALKNQLWSYTLELLEFYEDELGTLATLLEERHFLTGPEIDDICAVVLHARAGRGGPL
jgi:hypothetical protein